MYAFDCAAFIFSSKNKLKQQYLRFYILAKDVVCGALTNIDHSKTKARTPQTNGICERFHKTLKEEFYSIAFRKKLYHRLEELQLDLDIWMEEYNNNRVHSGRYCYGKTPIETFLDSKHLAEEKMLEKFYTPTQEENRTSL